MAGAVDFQEIESYRGVVEDVCGWKLEPVWNYRADSERGTNPEGEPPIVRVVGAAGIFCTRVPCSVR